MTTPSFDLYKLVKDQRPNNFSSNKSFHTHLMMFWQILMALLLLNLHQSFGVEVENATLVDNLLYEIIEDFNDGIQMDTPFRFKRHTATR